MINFSFVGSITFLPACLAKQTSFHLFSLDNVAIGGMLSAIVLFMGVFGQFVGGILAQKPHLERRLLLVNILSFPFILAMSFTTNLLLLFLGLIFFFLNFFLQPMTNTLLARYTTLEMRGTAFGIFFFVRLWRWFLLPRPFSGLIAQRVRVAMGVLRDRKQCPRSDPPFVLFAEDQENGERSRLGPEYISF